MALELRTLRVSAGISLCSAVPVLRWTLGGSHTASCSSRNQGVSQNLEGDEKGRRRKTKKTVSRADVNPL